MSCSVALYKKYTCVFFLICFCAQFSTAQEAAKSYVKKFEAQASNMPENLVYLQTNKTIYEAGEDFWFKAYIMHAQFFTLSVADTTLYVQLRSRDDKKVCLQEKFLINNGVVAGHLLLPDTLTSGDYLLSAFSPNSTNFPMQDVKSIAAIQIANRQAKPLLQLEATISTSENRITANVKKEDGAIVADALIKVTLFNADTVTGFYTAKTDKKGQLNYKFPDSSLNKVTKVIVRANKEQQEDVLTLPVPLQNKPISFGLYPEGGQLVSRLPGNVAFKANNPDGTPKDVKGVLLENGQASLKFKSEHNGMGRFAFSPKPGKNYTVQLTSSNTLYNLNIANNAGYVLKQEKPESGQLHFKVYKSSSQTPSTIYVAMQIRGIICSLKGGMMEGDSLDFYIATEKFPQGIAEIQLLNDQFLPLAERLVYVNAEKKLNIKQTINKNRVGKRNEIKLQLQTTDVNGKPVEANLGLSVVKTNDVDQNSLNILTYSHLYQQVKGNIFNINNYFDEQNPDRHKQMDLLLMTQGWRNYTWAGKAIQQQKPKRSIFTQTITGSIEKMPETPMLMYAFTPQQDSYRAIKEVNSKQFLVKPEDLYAAAGGYLYLKLTGEEEKIENAVIKIDEPFHVISKTANYAWPLNYTQNDSTKEQDLPIATDNYLLSEVKVSANSFNKTYSDKYLGSLDSAMRLNMNTDYVGSCGMMNCPACGFGTKPVEGRKYGKWVSKRRPTAHPFEYDLNEIRSEIYKENRYSEEELMRMYHLTRTKGYVKEKVFYEPVYDKIDDKQANSPDFRNTLLWRPNIVTNEAGEATLRFFTSDVNGKFIIHTEGLDNSGLLGANETEFMVTSNPQ